MSGILSASVETYDHTQDDTMPDHYQQVFIISKMGWTPEGNILNLSKMYMIKQHQLPHVSPEVSMVLWLRTPFYWHMTMHHWVIGSRSFGGKWCLNIQGSTGEKWGEGGDRICNVLVLFKEINLLAFWF
jgi:hypothetical protein